MIDIYRKTAGVETLVASLADDNATLERGIMGADEVTLNVTASEMLDLRVEDYARLEGVEYKINREPDLVKASAVEYRYDVVLESPLYNLLDKIYMLELTGKSRFSLAGTLEDFVDLLLKNINREGFDSGWSKAVNEKGEVLIVETEVKTLTFDNTTCRDVLSKLADEFGTEYVVRGRTIAFHERVEVARDLVFEQGQGKGLYTLQRQNVDTDNTVTRAYVYGSTENLPAGYRDGQFSRLCPRERGTTEYIPFFENRAEYPKLVEREVYFDDVKPSFTGSADSVSADFLKVSCKAIDFDLNRMTGDEIRVNFLTGDLMGIAFVFDYDHSTRTMTLQPQEDDRASADSSGKRPQLPNTIWHARVGDKFTFTGITLPDAYVRNAEALLAEKGRKWMRVHSSLRVKYNLDVDYRYARETDIELAPGDVVGIVVPGQEEIQKLRVTSVKKQLSTGKLTCEVSNYLQQSLEDALNAKIQDVRSSIELDRSELLYNINATREWTTRNFGRLAENMEDGEAITWDADGWQIKTEKQVPDAVHWDTHAFDDYLNQAVKTDSDVQFRDLLMRSFKSLNFAAGPLGAGVGMVNDNELQTDRLLVRKLMFVVELMIQKVRHQGGILILSSASMTISKVVDGDNYWKCYFENDGGNIANEFEVDDQVRLQNFSGGDIKYLWARVTAIGDDYIHLSKTDKDGDGIPVEGDDLVQLGHRTNPDRQDAILLSAVNGETGIITYYGINGFDLSGKEGSWFGKHGGKKGAVIRGEVHITSGSSGLKELDEFKEVEQNIQDAQQTADEAIAKAVKIVQVTAPSQVFKYAAGYTGAPTPESILLTATAKNFTPTTYKWQYLDGNTWKDLPETATAIYLVVPGDTTLFPVGINVRTFRCTCNGDINLFDSFTIAKLADGEIGATGATGKPGDDGKPGVDAYTVLLTNEAQAVACDASGNPLTGELTKAITKVVAYQGTSEVVFTIQNLISVGGTFELDGNNGVTCTALTSDSAACTFEINVGDTVLKKVFSICKAKAGRIGATGATGPKGDTGPVGSQGIPGTSQYFHVKYSANSSGNPMVDTPNTYIGTAVTTSTTAPTSYTSYKWVQLKGSQGPKGDQGIKGNTGANGLSSYLHIKYSNDGTSFTANDGETPGAYIGQYVDTEPTDSMTFSKYIWTKVKGDKGDKGDKGATGATGPVGSQGIPGTSQYFHVKYSANSTGNPMVDTPSTYIGTVVTTSVTAPTSYTSYKWVQLKGSQGPKGDQGIKGTAGANGVSSYLHIKYSDNGTSFTANNGEDPGAYIGQYVDTTPTDSMTFSKYVWTKVKGDKGDKGATGATGKGVSSIVEQYYLSTSATTQTGGTWVTTPPTWVDGRYYWTRSVITYTGDSPVTTTPVCVTGGKGATGNPGATGNGINKVDILYYLSTSAMSLSGGSWSTTAPAWVNGRYMWSRTKVTYTSGAFVESAPACITGAKGETENVNGLINSSKDTFAQQMGYSSFQNMADQAVAKGGKLVVDGLSNSIKANMLSVAGFTFQDYQIYGGKDFGVGGGVKITGTNAERSFKAYKDASNYISMFYNSDSDWGLKGVVRGAELLKLGITNKIGPFTIEGTWLRGGNLALSGGQLNYSYSGHKVFVGSHPDMTTAGNAKLGTFMLSGGSYGGLTSNKQVALIAGAPNNNSSYALALTSGLLKIFSGASIISSVSNHNMTGSNPNLTLGNESSNIIYLYGTGSRKKVNLYSGMEIGKSFIITSGYEQGFDILTTGNERFLRNGKTYQAVQSNGQDTVFVAKVTDTRWIACQMPVNWLGTWGS